MPDNGTLPPTSTTASTTPYRPSRSDQSNQSVLLPDATQQAITKMVRINPELARDPATIQSIANRYGVHSEQVAMAMTQAQHSNVVHRSVFGNIWHGLTDFFTNGNNWNGGFTTPTGQFTLQKAKNFASGFGRGLVKGVTEIPSGVMGLVQQANNIEQGIFNPLGTNNKGQANWKTGLSTVGDIAMLPRTLAAATMSEVKRNGWGYALGHLAPSLAGGKGIDIGVRALAGREGITAAEAAAAKQAAQVAADRATVENATGGLSFEDQVAASEAAMRLKTSDRINYLRNQERIVQEHFASNPDFAERLNAIREKIVKAQEENFQANFGAQEKFAKGSTFNKSIDAARRFAEAAGGVGIKLPIEALRAFNRVMFGTTANATAMLRMPIIQTDPELWKAAIHGQVIDQNGQKMSVGDAIARELPGPGFFHDIVARVLDFDYTFVGDDPFVKGFKLLGQAKSASGFTGYLGKFFGGMGITHAGDFARAFRQYGSVRRAVEYMASHNAAEINNTFRNMFDAQMLTKLERAQTPQEVVSLMEDVVAAGEYVGSVAPTMGWYTAFKTALTGKLGERFGTLGGLLESEVEVDRALRDEVLAQKGYDIRPKNYLYQRMNAAGKATVMFRQRLRAQFLRTPEHFDRALGKATNRMITPGSVEAVNSIADMMKAVYQPDLVVNRVSQILIHSAADPNAYRRAYRQAMYEVFMRPLEASMSRVEYQYVNKAISDHVWEQVNRLTGNDGGGAMGRYVAGPDEWRDIIATPMGDVRAGIGETHLGKLVLPSARTVKQIQRHILETALSLNGYAAKRSLISTEATLKDLKELANFSDKQIEDVLKNLGKTLEEKRLSSKDLWETKSLYKGYSAKYNSLLKKYSIWLADGAMKNLSRAEKIALVFKDVSDETRKVTEQFLRLSDEVTSRLGIVPPGFTASAEDLTTFAESLGMSEEGLLNAMDTLRGEQQAVEDMLANLNATFSESFDSIDEVMKIARDLASATIKNAEARSEFLKRFKESWEAKADAIPGNNRFTQRLGKTFFGKRGFRNNREMVGDMMQAYLNKFFKPMALSSPGWAMRVSASEAMLNSFRIGGMNFFESHLAASIAKHEMRLAERVGELEKMGKPEKLVLRNVVSGIMLGLERSAVGALGDPQKARLVADAVDAMLDHDAHLLMNMEAHSDAMSGDNLENYIASTVHGLDKEGKPEVATVFKTEGYTILQANDSAAGTALHENLNRVFNDSILHEGAMFLHNEAKAVGTALFAANEESVMKRVYDEAIRRIENGPGKDAWKARNDFIDQLRQEVMAMAEFRNVNDAERKMILDLIASKAKTVDDVLTENVPKYMQGTYERANLNIAKSEEAISRIERQIVEQQKIVEQYEQEFRLSLLDPETSIYTKSIGDRLDEADARLSELGVEREILDRQIANHPFRQYYTALESGAALNPYKPVLNDLREQLTEQVASAQRDAESRIKELLGEQPVVLPKAGFVDLNTERMMSFRDAAGEPIPNETAYLEAFNKHPEMWSDNDSYSRWVPFGTPGVHGRDFLDALGGRASIEEVQKLVRYEQQLAELHAALRANKFKEAYEVLDGLDPTTVSEISPILKAGSVDLTHASQAFSVNGVSPELILGHGRTQEKTLADLALHMRQKNVAAPNMFDKSFFPSYSPDEGGKIRFTADFEKHLKALTSKSASDAEKATAAKWFSRMVDPDPEKWATTANKVWKQNLDLVRNRVARDANRKEYYELLEKRKELSAQRSKIGVEKREILRDSGLPSEPSDVASETEKEMIAAANRLEALQKQRALEDAKLVKAHERRDTIEQHVVSQDAKYRDRLAKDADKMYKARVAKGTKGLNALIKRIEARTATVNNTVERTSRSVIDEVVSGLSSKGLSGDALDGVRERLTGHMYSYLNSLPADTLARFQRSMFCRKIESTGDPLLDWSQDITEHLLTLTSSQGDKVFFPELAKQMADGNTWGPEKMAQWLSERVRTNKPHPTNFPYRRYVPPLSAGSRSNFLVNLSDKVHTKFLAPIVNELVREPLYVWEYHQQMELLRPRVAQGLLTMDQAKVKAYTDAAINMGKYVHDPLGKTVWENNWRIAAPFYFAKNQAIRRALRMAGDDMAAFYKYLHLNLAITDFVAQSADGSNNFVVPGAEILSGIGAGVTSAIMYAQGYRGGLGMGQMNFGLDASPTSVMSVIITGTKPGALNVAKDMISMPFGPIVTFPAKLIYETVAQHNPLVERVLTDILGEASMRTTALDEMLPNSFLRNSAKGIWGFFNQNNPSAYTSTELYVMGDMAQQKFDEFYAQAKADHPSLDEGTLKQFGSREQLWAFYAERQFTEYFNDPNNYNAFVQKANLRTAFLYSIKTVMSYSSPTAVSIGERFLKNKEFAAIAKEKDKDGQLKYPTYFLQADEFTKRYPNRVFDLIGHTKSPGARWPETVEALKFMEDNWHLVRAMPNASAYLVSTQGDKFENRALQLEYALGTRQRETPKEFMTALQVSIGNRYYGQLYNAYKADPSNLDPNTGQLNYQAAMDLRRRATLYGQTINPLWLADKNSGRKNNIAYKTFNEMKQLVNDPSQAHVFPEGQLAIYKQLVAIRAAYEQAYNNAVLNGEKTGAIRSQWYDWCTQLANNEQFRQYSGFVTEVMRNLPNPQ